MQGYVSDSSETKSKENLIYIIIVNIITTITTLTLKFNIKNGCFYFPGSLHLQ